MKEVIPKQGNGPENWERKKERIRVALAPGTVIFCESVTQCSLYPTLVNPNALSSALPFFHSHAMPYVFPFYRGGT